MIIDAWAQHATLRHLNHPMFESLRRWTRGEIDSRVPVGDSAEWPVSVTLAAMDEAGITRSLICAWEGPRGSLISNDEVAAFVRTAPDRLVGVGSVDISRPRAAVLEIRRCVRELGIPFCTQVGHTGPLMPSDVGRPIPHIDQVAIDFPGLVVVCGHIGYP